MEAEKWNSQESGTRRVSNHKSQNNIHNFGYFSFPSKVINKTSNLKPQTRNRTFNIP
jgi:hypothetical protein